MATKKLNKESVVYIATLYRFGYDLTVAETTEEKAIAALREEYIRAYKDINGVHPQDEESDRAYSCGRSALEVAMDDVEIREMTIGKVEWR